MPQYTHLLLDLDDTLYPASSGVWEAVRERIQSFMEQRLSLSENKAASLRQRYLEQFGTTLSGLVEEFGIDPLDYLKYVHNVPVGELLSPDPELRQMLASIDIPRAVFTNAFLPHAQRVLQQLGVEDQIDQVIDIFALGFLNKPKPEAYHLALDMISAKDPARVVMVDDRPANLEPARDLNIITVLVSPDHETQTHLRISQIHELTGLLPDLLGGGEGGPDDG